MISRRGFIRGAISLAAAPAVSLAARPVVARAASVATASPDPVQTMEGFGAAGAWWPIDLSRFRPQVQERLAALLFAPAPNGIALSAYRYNIGAGGVGVTDPSRAPETFLVGPGRYDWTRDAGGTAFLRLARRHGVPNLVGFANSAPPAWTTNHQSCGGSLLPGAEAEYARYLADVVDHLGSVEGIPVSYVSPMNEPDYRFEGGSQEGMGVPVAQRSQLVRSLGDELTARALRARVLADESSRVVDQLLPEAPGWLGVDDTPRRLAAVAHHLYDFPDAATLGEARRLGEQAGLPLWATELCCIRTETGAFGQEYDPTIANAVRMAELIWRALTHANDAAFHWWVAASSAMGVDPGTDPQAAQRPNSQGWNDGLVYYDPGFARNGNQTLYLTRRYHAMGNFSRYVRPGARRHDVDGVPEPLRALVFSADLGWVVVAINLAPAGSGAALLELQLPVGVGGLLVPLETVETSAERGLEPVPPPAIERGRVRAALPAQSVTTLVLAGPAPAPGATPALRAPRRGAR